MAPPVGGAEGLGGVLDQRDLVAGADLGDGVHVRPLAVENEVNTPTLAEWQAAREQVRAGKITIEGMKREVAESPRRIEIKKKQTFAAKDNAVDPQAAVAA